MDVDRAFVTGCGYRAFAPAGAGSVQRGDLAFSYESGWRDVPERYGPWSTVYSRFNNWARAGVFQGLMDALIAEAAGRGVAGLELVSMDSTVVRAHHDSAGLAVAGETLDALERALTEEKGVPLRHQPPVWRVVVCRRPQRTRSGRPRRVRTGPQRGGGAGPRPAEAASRGRLTGAPASTRSRLRVSRWGPQHLRLPRCWAGARATPRSRARTGRSSART
ncbi:transposase [Streptacidiphilus sp. 4-A2]|nr:transposase [Streptacidiphilus sp. 4-A2]